jgi:hypothetical protein
MNKPAWDMLLMIRILWLCPKFRASPASGTAACNAKGPTDPSANSSWILAYPEALDFSFLEASP